MKNKLLFSFGVFVVVCFSQETAEICPEVAEIAIQVDKPMTCAYPMSAVGKYLLSDTPLDPACSMFTATDRFNRFREYIHSLGGFVNEKVTFRRGYYMNPVTKRLSYSVGGLFLKPHEVLRQGETIFYVPEEATFGEKMIKTHLPFLPKFMYGKSYRFWACLGLAALFRYFPFVVGPWEALLPEISYHPQLWSDSELSHLKGTSAFTSITSMREHVEGGCSEYSELLDIFELTCKDVLIAYALVQSRSFGFDNVPCIPFGPDLLNHNPHAVSWIGRVPYGPAESPYRTDIIFYLNSYTLTESRELFNNYGPHGMTSALIAYGFTAPDEVDELVIVATADGVFNGKHFPITSEARDSCPAAINFKDLTLNKNSFTCSADFVSTARYGFDIYGNFRLVGRDYEIISFDRNFPCQNPVGGFIWGRAAKRLRELNVKLVPMEQYLLKFNVLDGVEPHVSPQQAAWMTVCSLKEFDETILLRASQCPISTSSRYIEEYPLHPLVKSRVRKVMHAACTMYEMKNVGSFENNLWKWIAYRNLKIKRTQKKIAEAVFLKDVSSSVNSREARDLLEDVVRGKNTLHVDTWGIIDDKMIQSSNESASKLFFLEEITKYRMQLAYLARKKCSEPLESGAL